MKNGESLQKEKAKKTMMLGSGFENDTYYIADKPYYDLDVSDTVCAKAEIYRSIVKEPAEDRLNTCFYLKDKKNITLDFAGATLYLRGRLQPFILDNCENITIKNCAIQYDRSFVSEFEVLERGEDYILMKPNPNHPVKVEDGILIPYSDTWENKRFNHGSHFIQTFDKETHEGCGIMLAIIGNTVYQDPDAYAPGVEYRAEMRGENIILWGKPHYSWQVGKILAESSEPRIRSSMTIVNSASIYLENYRVINGSGMGILPIHSKDIFIKGLIFTHDEVSPGIVTNAADAIHAIACSGQFEMKDSIIEGMIDDAINIHSMFFTLENASGNRMQIASRGWLPSACNVLDVGDKIAIYKPLTMEKLAEYTVLDKKIIDKQQLELVLDDETKDFPKGALIENLTGNADITLKNCKIGKANSHMRFQSRGRILLENCEFGLRTIQSGDASYWFESSPCTDFTAQNCTFTREAAVIALVPEVMPTDAAPYYHRNLTFENCSFVSEVPIYGHQADNIVFKNNTNALGKPMRLELVNCGSVTCNCAEVIRKKEKKEALGRN